MRPSRSGLLCALLVFGVASVAVFGELWRQGPSAFVPLTRENDPSSGLARVGRADVTFEAWLVSRNARTLATRPHRLFDTPHCAPAENTLTLGIPMITMGALAIPAYFATRDPVLTYNATLVTLTLVAALAAYAVVAAWTGVPAAGIVAGLLYGFHPTRLADIAHPSVRDTAWVLLALLFAERLFAHGRWRDAVGLAASTALQIGASFYSLLAGALLAPPFAFWLLHRDRLRHVSPGQLGFVLAGVALAGAALLGPYLVAPAAEDMRHPQLQFPGLWRYLPGGKLFPGWSLLLLVVCAWVLPPRASELRLRGDPRRALLAGVALVALVAAGPTHRALVGAVLPESLAQYVPDLYAALASFVPGLDAIRNIWRLSQGVLVGLTLLAGLGAAALVRRSGRYAVLTAVALVLVAGFEVLRAPQLGFERRYRWGYADIRPSDADVAFFAELARRGNSGALLEIPVDGGWTVVDGPPRILLTAYHQRRTSACFGSYAPAGRRELAALAARLPDPAAIASLTGMGFTTVVFHAAAAQGPILRQLTRMERAVTEGAGVELVHAAGGKAAYRLRDPTG